jgi:acyl-CoA reductase-like NAD-dependent aldehyde dehydrogenase
LPAGLLNLVLCDDESTCEMLADPRITQASFTGSEKVGWNLRAKAPTKPLSLELGGAAPAYVDESADLDLAASALAHGALSYSGQTCISVQSIHVHRKVAAAFREKLIAEWGKIAAADPALAEAQVGPVIDAQAADRLESLAARLLADGARVTALGTPVKNGLAANTPYVQPRLFEELSIEDDFYSQECFGPFAALREVESFEQFRDFANQLPARLQTCVFTRDLAQAHAAARGLRYGGVVVNQSANFRMDPMPYGGRGRAGSGREGPLSALREYTEEKSVLIRT